ncbi:hypothetical protein [Apilactobacillus nanyangensis]|uniref:hypothetical protein n=1 Tax=Apilactobacillus nanyangensis TaxID=2799579 RepID=UPI0019405429|nr:hypothetical protein [Apilactobacillus nanyangensis]
MKDITEIACESYKEDLKSYDNPDYVITYPEYDWKMSYIAYDAMLNELTDYHDLNQPDTDYETFGVKNNMDVIDILRCFQNNYRIFLVENNKGINVHHTKGKVEYYYMIIKCSLC